MGLFAMPELAQLKPGTTTYHDNISLMKDFVSKGGAVYDDFDG